MLSTDGSEGGYYEPESLAWSPDSTRLAVYKVRPGQRRYVHYVESSPEDQLQPKHSVLQYAKPGDVLDVERPVLFHVETKARIAVDTALFPDAYDMSRLDWRPDSSAVTFEYNQRGHQVYRVISDRRRLRRRPGGHHRRIEDVLLLLRQEVPPRPGRRQADRLDVRARRMEPSLPLRRRDRIGEVPDHARRVGGPQRRPGRHEGAADLFRRERHVSREGSVFRPLLPHQPRWHRTPGPDQVRRQSHHRPVRRCQAVRRYLFDAWTPAR